IENGIPASLRQAVFEHSMGGVAGPLMLDSGTQMLAIVTKIHHPAITAEPQKMTPAREAELHALAESFNQAIQLQAFAAMAEKYGVKVNGRAFASDPAEAQ